MSTLTASTQRRDQAAQFGVMLFLASESLLFAGLFALYAGCRARHPSAFAFGVRHDLRWLGSLNTAIMLLSSTFIAIAMDRLQRNRVSTARLALATTMLLGVAFLGLKLAEYADHIHHGIIPGGNTEFLTSQAAGLTIFVTLYYLMTGLHGLHVMAGLIWLGCLWRVLERGPSGVPALALGALYWHFIDVIWIFLWPLFYLLGHAP